MKSAKFGIIGYGVLGQSTSLLLDSEPVIYDQYKNIGNLESVKNTDVMFICINTIDESGNLDFSGLNQIVDDLNDYNGLIVIRSTVSPEYAELSSKNYVFMPEFFFENNSFMQMLEPRNYLIGGNVENLKMFETIIRSQNAFAKNDLTYCTAYDAISTKLVRNLYGAYKVLFWNFVHEQFGNQRAIYELLETLPSQGDMQIVGLDGHLGYGGKCYPKDVNIANQWKNHELLNFMESYNTKLKSGD